MNTHTQRWVKSEASVVHRMYGQYNYVGIWLSVALPFIIPCIAYDNATSAPVLQAPGPARCKNAYCEKWSIANDKSMHTVIVY